MFIYALADPNTNQVRYVGKSINATRRLADHMRTARNGGKTHRDCWIRSLNCRPNLIVLEEVTEENWQDREKFWIASYPNLTNHTAGGEGIDSSTASRINKGRPVTDATKKKMSIALKRRYQADGLPWDVGHYTRTSWHIQRIRETTGKLNQEIVDRIRCEYANGALQKDLARTYSVSQSCISKIVLNKMWSTRTEREDHGGFVT